MHVSTKLISRIFHSFEDEPGTYLAPAKRVDSRRYKPCKAPGCPDDRMVVVNRKLVNYREHPKCSLAEVLRLREQGMSLIQIGRMLGVSKAIVSEVFLSRPDADVNYLAHPRCSAADVARFRSEGKTFAQIARELHVGRKTVTRVFRALQSSQGVAAQFISVKKTGRLLSSSEMQLL
jgi:DNA-binding CsgD family transcriptional regulator